VSKGKGNKGGRSGGHSQRPSPLKKSGRRDRPAPRGAPGEIYQQAPRPDPLKGKPGGGKGGG
jgi:hypothetical protein